MAKLSQVNINSCLSELEQSNTIFKVNGWASLAAEAVSIAGFEGTVLYFPGVTYNQLKKK